MNNRGAKINGFPVWTWLAQISIALIAITLAAWSISTQTGVGMFIGGGIAVISNGLFILFAYRYQGARSAALMVNSMYFGETVKLVFIAGALAVVFWFGEKSIAQYSLIGVITLSVVSWLISVRLLNQSRHS